MLKISSHFKSNNYEDSTLFEYVFDFSNKNLLIVCAYAEDVIQKIITGGSQQLVTPEEIAYHIDFRKMFFTGIRKYERGNATAKLLKGYENDYQYLNKPIVRIQKIVLKTLEEIGLFELFIDFGHFGDVKFLFTQFTEQRLLVYSKEEDGNKSYVNALTNEEIDIDSPFR